LSGRLLTSAWISSKLSIWSRRYHPARTGSTDHGSRGDSGIPPNHIHACLSFCFAYYIDYCTLSTTITNFSLSLVVFLRSTLTYPSRRLKDGAAYRCEWSDYAWDRDHEVRKLKSEIKIKLLAVRMLLRLTRLNFQFQCVRYLICKFYVALSSRQCFLSRFALDDLASELSQIARNQNRASCLTNRYSKLNFIALPSTAPRKIPGPVEGSTRCLETARLSLSLTRTALPFFLSRYLSPRYVHEPKQCDAI
jgi:hypothetical protein